MTTLVIVLVVVMLMGWMFNIPNVARTVAWAIVAPIALGLTLIFLIAMLP